MIKWVGSFGTGALLLMAGFSYFIWRFNPTFNTPNFDFLIPKKKAPETDEALLGGFVPDTPAVKKEWDLNKAVNENKGEGVAVIMPEMDEHEEGGKLFIDELAPTLVIDEPAENEIAENETVQIIPDEVEDFSDLDDELLEDLDLEINEGTEEAVVPVAAIGSLATKSVVAIAL